MSWKITFSISQLSSNIKKLFHFLKRNVLRSLAALPSSTNDTCCLPTLLSNQVPARIGCQTIRVAHGNLQQARRALSSRPIRCKLHRNARMYQFCTTLSSHHEQMLSHEIVFFLLKKRHSLSSLAGFTSIKWRKMYK